MKNLRFLITTLTISLLISSEMITVISSIKDSEGNLIKGVNIYTDRNGVSTDQVGSFNLVCFPNEIVTISHISFSDITLKASDIPKEVVMNLRNINTDEIIIKGGSFEKSLKETNNSLMLLQSEDIDRGRHQHFEDAIALIPNLNSSGGTSRARYFQIRGIGELSQFSGEGPPHFYVGYVMDDIDFSGIGMAGLLNDIKQIEVFKGPQSSIYGPNAMAGLINISSNDPTPHKEGNISLVGGNDNHMGLSAYYSSPLMRNLFHRISLFVNKSDGFRENSYLNVTDTNKRDEMMMRYKLFYSPKDNITMKMTYYFIDIKNGYDIWSPDNNGFTTYSDYIGKDTQKANALSFRTTIRTSNDLKLSSITSFSINNIEYNYDSDWANDTFWRDNYDWYEESESYDFENEDLFEFGYYPYIFTDETTRKRNNISQDFRVSGKSMIGGIYLSQTTEDDVRMGYLMGGVDSLASHFEMLNISIYSSAEWSLTQGLSLITKARVENNIVKSNVEAKAYGLNAGDFTEKVSSILWGGRIGLNQALNQRSNIGVSLSKGYKSQGVNQSINIGSSDYPLSEDLRSYDDEDAYNFELFYTYKDKTKFLSLNSFYLHRVNPQIRLSYQLDPENPISFDFYTVNTKEGYSYGFEGEFRAMITDRLYFYDSFAMLKSYISSFEFFENSVGNRTEAHAPEFSASGGFEYTMKSGIYMKFDHSVMFDFYHEDQYESKTEPYQILNTVFGWRKNKIELSMWVKNLLDEKYTLRGYNFALEPSPNTPPHFFSNTYLSYGDPRHFGASFSYSF